MNPRSSRQSWIVRLFKAKVSFSMFVVVGSLVVVCAFLSGAHQADPTWFPRLFAPSPPCSKNFRPGQVFMDVYYLHRIEVEQDSFGERDKIYVTFSEIGKSEQWQTRLILPQTEKELYIDGPAGDFVMRPCGHYEVTIDNLPATLQRHTAPAMPSTDAIVTTEP